MTLSPTVWSVPDTITRELLQATCRIYALLGGSPMKVPERYLRVISGLSSVGAMGASLLLGSTLASGAVERPMDAAPAIGIADRSWRSSGKPCPSPATRSLTAKPIRRFGRYGATAGSMAAVSAAGAGAISGHAGTTSGRAGTISGGTGRSGKRDETRCANDRPAGGAANGILQYQLLVLLPAVARPEGRRLDRDALQPVHTGLRLGMGERKPIRRLARRRADGLVHRLLSPRLWCDR